MKIILLWRFILSNMVDEREAQEIESLDMLASIPLGSFVMMVGGSQGYLHSKETKVNYPSFEIVRFDGKARERSNKPDILIDPYIFNDGNWSFLKPRRVYHGDTEYSTLEGKLEVWASRSS